MKKIILLIVVLCLLLSFYIIPQNQNQSSLELLVSNDPNMANPYSITLINPEKFANSIKDDLYSSLNESIFITNYFLHNLTSNVIKNYKITENNVFNINNLSLPLNINKINENSSLIHKITFGVTTTLESSGILDLIINDISNHVPFNVSFIVKGSNSIINDAMQGNFNVILTHSPNLEKQLIDKNFTLYNSLLFSSEFIIIGPKQDPANIKNLENGSLALSKIYTLALSDNNIKFISRGDSSGTNIKELELWNKTNLNFDYQNHSWLKENSWYIITGSSQSASYLVAQEYNGYMIIDFPSFLQLSASYSNNNLNNDLSSALSNILTVDPILLPIIVLSLQIHLTAIILATIIGLIISYLLYKINFKGKTIFISVIQSFIAFPPIVLGLIMWYIFSRTGILGNLKLLYTSPIMVLAQFILALPIIISLTFNSFETLDSDLIELSTLFGYKNLRFISFLFSESKYSIITAVITALGRIMGETGAMLIIGGYIFGETRIITTSIVNEIESGNPEEALALGIILLTITLLIITILTLLQRNKKFLPHSVSFRYSWFKINKDFKLTGLEIDKNFTNNSENEFENFLELIDDDKNKLKSGELLSLRNCNYVRDSEFSLQIESFHLQKGKIYGIIGPNSAGKTTFCKLLVNLITVNNCIKIGENVQENWQYLHQIPVFFSGTVYDNFIKSMKFNKDSKSLKSKKILLLANTLGIGKYLGHEVRHLSVGIKQKVALIRTLLQNPEVLVLDESFSNLDMKSTILVSNLIKKLQQTNRMTFILVSHNITMLSKIVEEFVFIDDGKLIESFSIENLISTNHELKTNEYLAFTFKS